MGDMLFQEDNNIDIIGRYIILLLSYTRENQAIIQIY